MRPSVTFQMWLTGCAALRWPPGFCTQCFCATTAVQWPAASAFMASATFQLSMTRVCYNQVAAGEHYTALLRSAGSAVACDRNNWGQCDLADVVAVDQIVYVLS